MQIVINIGKLQLRSKSREELVESIREKLELQNEVSIHEIDYRLLLLWVNGVAFTQRGASIELFFENGGTRHEFHSAIAKEWWKNHLKEFITEIDSLPEDGVHPTRVALRDHTITILREIERAEAET